MIQARGHRAAHGVGRPRRIRSALEPVGRHALYLSGDRRLLAVPAVGPNGEPILGAPKSLFSSAAVGPTASGSASTTPSTPDARRVPMLVAAGANGCRR